MILIVCVDDIILTGDNPQEFGRLKKVSVMEMKLKTYGNYDTSWEWKLQDQRRG